MDSFSMSELNKMISDKTQSKTTTAKITNQVQEEINKALSEHQEQTTQSMGMAHTGETFEVAASKRYMNAKPSNTLENVDLNLEGTVQYEIQAAKACGEKKANDAMKPLDYLLENLSDACVKVLDSHIDRLFWKFKPKLVLAQEKVARLEKIVEAKKKQREQREQLVKLNQQIAHFKVMKKQLSNRENNLDEKIEELRQECED